MSPRLNRSDSISGRSILFPMGYFEREVIKTVEVVRGLRNVAIPLELVRIEFNALDPPPLDAEFQRLSHQMVPPLLEGSGRHPERWSGRIHSLAPKFWANRQFA